MRRFQPSARRRVKAGLYVFFMPIARLTRRSLMRPGARPPAPELELHMDFVFVGLGLGMFALFALYAVLLRRV
jgi:hypothetical protein